ncbi:streptogramin A acetyl transferase [unidentified eubacterium SCB49]|nr:streptogramin A acetyl transferase [unidentified eubacterium SCB49]
MYKLRFFLLRILGIPYTKLMRNLDFIYLKDDVFTQMGTRSYENGAKVWRWTESKIVIGNYCSIARDVNFITDHGSHLSSSIANFPLLDSFFSKDHIFSDGESKKNKLKKMIPNQSITIGNDVWLGMGVYILPGVKIGNGVTIAASSVVTKDIPDYAVVGGVPAQILKMKHTPEVINALNEIAWWNWTENEIKQRIDDFHKPLDLFVEKYKK